MGGALRARYRSTLEPDSRPSKRQLEITLGQLEVLESPQLKLEQYPVSPEVAAELLYMAGFEHNDIRGKQVVDLGTGTGRLAIGAGLLGARSVVGVDMDKSVLALARKNAEAVGVAVEWLTGHVNDVEGRFDTVVMNPPYGTRSRHRDVKFLAKAFQLAPTTYSIHKAATRNFIIGYAGRHGVRVDEVRSMRMSIPHLFSFHKKKWKSVEIDVYRFSLSG